MDYTQELQNLLRPLGIYDVDGGVGAAELSAAGTALTGVWSALSDAEMDANPLTAADGGLADWESLLPFVPAWNTAADRRRAIAALLRIDGASFTPAAINDTIAGCGIRAVVAETETPMTVSVSFPWNRGEPDDLDALKARIEQILPCHLDVEYVFIRVVWRELEALIASWAALAAAELTWRALEKLGGEE